ncbi:unnamed protein product [Lampetra planeri]
MVVDPSTVHGSTLPHILKSDSIRRTATQTFGSGGTPTGPIRAAHKCGAAMREEGDEEADEGLALAASLSSSGERRRPPPDPPWSLWP